MIEEALELEEGIYTLYGPFKGVIVEGKILHAGRLLGEGEEFFTPKDHTSCMKVMSAKALIKFNKGMGGNLKKSNEESEPIENWLEVSENIVNKGYKTVLVIGEPDSGKSSFTTFLANHAFSKGLKVAVIDADPGQNDIAYPGTIGLTFLKKTISWLRELNPDKIFFIGSTSPMNNEDMVILGAYKLVNEAVNQADIVIVNSDGWVEGSRALRYKSRLIMALNPDTLILMRGSGAVSYMSKCFEKFTKVFQVRSPLKILPKEHGQRRIRREISYVDLLLHSTPKIISMDKVGFLGTLLFAGNEVKSELIDKIILRCEKTGNYLVLLVRNRNDLKKVLEIEAVLKKAHGTKGLKVIPLEDLKGLLVGLVDSKLEFIGVGVLNKIDIKNRKIHLLTYVDEEKIAGVVPGAIVISEDGKEIRRISHLI